MFGLGFWELVVIAVVALLFVGPDKLPEATRKISRGIRDFRKQTRELTKTLNEDHDLSSAVRDLKSALRGDDFQPLRPRPPVPPPPTPASPPQERVAGEPPPLPEPARPPDGPPPEAPAPPPDDDGAPVIAPAADAIARGSEPAPGPKDTDAGHPGKAHG